MTLDVKTIRLQWLLGVLAIFLITGSSTLSPIALSVQVVHASGTKSFTLDAYTSGWNATTNPNPTLALSAGDIVSLYLQHQDSSPHQFYIDTNGNGVADCPQEKCKFFSSTVTFNFTIDFPAGTYTYYCSIHPATMRGAFTVNAAATPDFGISVNPTSLTLLTGSNGASIVTISSMNNFSGTVIFTTSVSSGKTAPGPTASFTPQNITITSNGTNSSTLNITVPTGTSLGSYMVTVNGTGGGETHTTVLALTVTNAPGQTLPVPLTTIAGIAIVAGAIILVATYALRRRKPTGT